MESLFSLPRHSTHRMNAPSKATDFLSSASSGELGERVHLGLPLTGSPLQGPAGERSGHHGSCWKGESWKTPCSPCCPCQSVRQGELCHYADHASYRHHRHYDHYFPSSHLHYHYYHYNHQEREMCGQWEQPSSCPWSMSSHYMFSSLNMTT